MVFGGIMIYNILYIFISLNSCGRIHNSLFRYIRTLKGASSDKGTPLDPAPFGGGKQGSKDPVYTAELRLVPNVWIVGDHLRFTSFSLSLFEFLNLRYLLRYLRNHLIHLRGELVELEGH